MLGFATVQDDGRVGHCAEAVPRSGAMDVDSLARANMHVGNHRGAAAIEWTLAGGSIEFGALTVVAVAGAHAELSRNGTPFPAGESVTFGTGDELTVGRFVSGAFIYIAVGGGIDVPPVLGSRSTYLPAAFGGLAGRRLRAGDTLRTAARDGGYATAVPSPVSCATGAHRGPIRVVEGPDSSAFSTGFRECFWSSEFTLSRSSSRAGYRLDRQPDSDPEQRSLPSAPACIGAIQVPDGKSAIVLMPDGPTVGGYPKIGVVVSADIPALAQKTPGETVRFERVTLGDARRLLRGE